MDSTSWTGPSAPSGVESDDWIFESVGLPPPPRYVDPPRISSDESRLPSLSEMAKLRPLDGRVIKPRVRKGSAIEPSPYRPHVAAPDRLRTWVIPYSLSRSRDMLSEIPRVSLIKVNRAIIASLTEKTRGCYGAGLLFFHQYCNKVGISEEDRMPASSTLLAGFAAEQARDNIQGDTIEQYLTGLRAWHFINDAPWHGDDLFVRQVLKGVGVLSAPKGSKPPRPPVSLEHIVALSTHLHPHDWLDAVIWVVACIAFWACCRLGELLPDAEEQFDPKFFPERSDSFSSHPLSILTCLSEDVQWSAL
jgi:hypothetical protein